MPLVNTLLLLFRWLRQPRGAQRQPEPADLGTAFGMECWLEEQDAARPIAAPDASGGQRSGSTRPELISSPSA